MTYAPPVFGAKSSIAWHPSFPPARIRNSNHGRPSPVLLLLRRCLAPSFDGEVARATRKHQTQGFKTPG